MTREQKADRAFNAALNAATRQYQTTVLPHHAAIDAAALVMMKACRLARTRYHKALKPKEKR